MPEKKGLVQALMSANRGVGVGSQTSLGHSWTLFPKLDSSQEICIFLTRVLPKLQFVSLHFCISPESPHHLCVHDGCGQWDIMH